MGTNDLQSQQVLADHIAIGQLLNRYSNAATRRDWDKFAGVFTEDGIWDILAPFNMKYEGRANIRAGGMQVIDGFEFLVQMNHAPVIELLGPDTAKASSVINEMARMKEPPTSVFLLGVYHDDIVKVNGEWLFKHRRFESFYLDQSPLNGQCLVQYPGK